MSSVVEEPDPEPEGVQVKNLFVACLGWGVGGEGQGRGVRPKVDY